MQIKYLNFMVCEYFINQIVISHYLEFFIKAEQQMNKNAMFVRKLLRRYSNFFFFLHFYFADLQESNFRNGRMWDWK